MAEEQTITRFTTRVRQLVLRFNEMKQENARLCEQVRERDAEVERLRDELKKAQDEYMTLKMAKTLELTDTDLDAAKQRINKLLRDVNKCITMLGED